MLLTLALVVLFGSILVFFSQEFTRAFKKIYAIKGAELLLPLAIASWFVYFFDYWVLWLAYYYREVMQKVLSFLIYLIPFQQGATSIAMVVLLTACAVVPVFLLDLFYRKQTYKPYPYSFVTSAIIWVVTAVLIVIVGAANS